MELLLGHRPFRLRWVAEHTELVEGEGFEDIQRSGPFAEWRHRHRFEARADDTSVLRDSVEYRLPLSWLSEWMAGGLAAKELERLFQYRHRITKEDLEFHRAHASSGRLGIGLAGGRLPLLTALEAFLTTGGHRVVRVTGDLSEKGDSEARQRCEGLDALVLLDGPSPVPRARPESEEWLRSASWLPATLIVESSSIGRAVLESPGRRLVSVRLGSVLSPRFGLLSKVLPAFRVGLGGRLGDDSLWIDWIGIDDAVSALAHVVLTPSSEGLVDLASTEPVRGPEFGATLGRILGRPARRSIGLERARRLVRSFASSDPHEDRLDPRQLLATGYRFRESNLEATLRHLLGRAG